MKTLEFDCGVIGSGLAGLTVAIELAENGKKVGLFTKGKLGKNCSSELLAGGLSAVPVKNGKTINDTHDLHIEDTIKAGKELNDLEIVKLCVEKFYPDVIDWLAKKGVRFDKAENEMGYSLHSEGGHSSKRVFHVRDETGKEIMRVLSSIAKKHKNIQVFENHLAVDLITKNWIKKTSGKDECYGFYVYDKTKNIVKTVSCRGTFICTGGLGKVFSFTSNPDTATGDGFALAYRAGLELANMEFIQFHPTVFYNKDAQKEGERRFLLTEALRGAGAILKNAKSAKKDFVLNYDKAGSKATRDITTRAEDEEMRRNGLEHVWLDCTKIPSSKLKKEFKNAYEFCLSKGIDLTKESVPVMYAEHYSNGGVIVNKNGETKTNNCYVIGETSYTGLHGATRLASNSGPECVLFGRIAAKHFCQKKNITIKKIPLWKEIGKKERDEKTIEYYWEAARRTMNSLCGMSRNQQRLWAAKEIIESVNKGVNEFYWGYNVTKDFLEVRNIAIVAQIIVEGALFRKESRACHYREDFPKQNKNFSGLTIIRKNKKIRIRKVK